MPPRIVHWSSSGSCGRGFVAVGGGELAELCDGSGDDFEGVGDVSGGGVTAEAEANAGACIFWRHANRCEDMGRLDGTGRAGCSGGARKAFEI